MTRYVHNDALKGEFLTCPCITGAIFMLPLPQIKINYCEIKYGSQNSFSVCFIHVPKNEVIEHPPFIYNYGGQRDEKI